jgi:hypothetical protein
VPPVEIEEELNNDDREDVCKQLANSLFACLNHHLLLLYQDAIGDFNESSFR